MEGVYEEDKEEKDEEKNQAKEPWHVASIRKSSQKTTRLSQDKTRVDFSFRMSRKRERDSEKKGEDCLVMKGFYFLSLKA